ncbi:hypothetical protein SynA1524_01227 [Synechococcus sp. A15-24]|nr:hypothetical protein SynA1524_01227 [Synechococcus sp. A15-24]
MKSLKVLPIPTLFLKQLQTATRLELSYFVKKYLIINAFTVQDDLSLSIVFKIAIQSP